MQDWIQGNVVENIHWTKHLFSLRIDADVKVFKAGQFTSLALDIGGERIARPYSYLSYPSQRPVEFFFYTASGGILSNALVKLVPGDTVWIKQNANGFFTLDEVPDASQLWMLATGTGIAPYYSILRTDEVWQRFETLVLVHAVRWQSDLRYLEIVEQLKETYGERLRFQPFVSRETLDGALPGRIPAALADGSLEAEVGVKLAVGQSQIMLCGNPDMVQDATDLLRQRGFRKNRRRTPGHITTENYW